MTYTPSSKNPFFGTHPRIEQKIPKMDVLQLSKEWECAICKRRAGLCTIPQNFFLEIFPSIFASLVSQREKRKWVKRNTKESEKKILLVEGKRFENKTWEAVGIPLYFFLTHTPLSSLQAFLGGRKKKKNAVQDLNFFPGWSCMHASHVFNKIHAGAFSLFR